MSKKRTRNRWTPKLVLTAIGLIAVLGYAIYKIGKSQLTEYFLKRETKHARGIVIDEKNFMGNSPVSREYTYSYLFFVNGKSYKNNSHDLQLKVGDSVDVEYSTFWPGFNKIDLKP